MKTILVADSYHGDTLAKILKGFYESEVNVYYEKDDRIFLLISKNPFRSEEVVFAEEKKIDVFFLSGKLILEGVLIPEVLKQRFGVSNSRVVAMSVDPSFIKEIKSGNHDVDFFIDKRLLFDSAGDLKELSPDEQQLVMSFLQ